jgi:chromosome segregation ATPase
MRYSPCLQKSELVVLNRQISHLTSQVTAKDKTISDLRQASSGSSNSQDREALTAKEDQIENMEIDLNKLRSELERTQTTLTTTQSLLKQSESAYSVLQGELSTAQNQLESASSSHQCEITTLTTQVRALQPELDGAKAELKKQTASFSALEKDYHTLKTMYREAETKSQESSRTVVSKSREAQDLEDSLAEASRKSSHYQVEAEELKLQLDRALAENRKITGAASVNDEEVDELEDAERKKLREKVRVLEEQLHHFQQSTSKANVTDTSTTHPSTVPQPRRARGLSEASLISGDVDFGEMMRKEIDAEADRVRMQRERLERIKETKRGLEGWRGWRMDLTLTGGSPQGLGEMFEV